jgi:hypothetical protein
MQNFQKRYQIEFIVDFGVRTTLAVLSAAGLHYGTLVALGGVPTAWSLLTVVTLAIIAQEAVVMMRVTVDAWPLILLAALVAGVGAIIICVFFVPQAAVNYLLWIVIIAAISCLLKCRN